MRRKAGLFLLAGVVVPLIVVAGASGQGASLQVSPQVASPGQVVNVSGGSFSSAADASAVHIRLDRRDGTSLKDTGLDTQNNINTTFLIPPGTSPGWHLVIATQTRQGGNQAAFTPARARIRIVAPASVLPPGRPPGEAPGGGWPVVPIAAIAALLLLSAITALTARRLRPRGSALGIEHDAVPSPRGIS